MSLLSARRNTKYELKASQKPHSKIFGLTRRVPNLISLLIGRTSECLLYMPLDTDQIGLLDGYFLLVRKLLVIELINWKMFGTITFDEGHALV